MCRCFSSDWGSFFLFLACWEIFLWMNVEFCQSFLFASITIAICFFSFSLLICKLHWFLNTKPTFYSWDKTHLVIIYIFFIYWIQFANVLLRISLSMSLSNIEMDFPFFRLLLSFFSLSLYFFSNQGNNHRVSWEVLPSVLFLKKDSAENWHCIFHKCLMICTSEIWDWCLLWRGL